MVLIVASRVDASAPRLASALHECPARVLTPLDLSRPGWRVFSGRPGSDIGIVDGEAVESRRVEGVVCLLPRVFPRELVHIEAEDRAYVAEEMTAFLIFWLSTLACPKMNAPTAGCLSGPLWSQVHWLAAAASAGLPITPHRRSTQSSDRSSSEFRRTVTVVGPRTIGDDDGDLRRYARLLASWAGMHLLSVHFTETPDGPRFSGVDPFPELATPAALEGVLAFFDEGLRA